MAENDTFWMDEYLKVNMNVILEEAIPGNWDCVGLVFGKEGAGKTTFAVQICKYLDPTFTHERVVFTPEQFEKACDDAQGEESILWDEAITGASIDKQMGSMSKSIVTRLTMIRKKKLKIVILLPYLLMMQKYFINRCMFSVYIYAKSFSQRGFYKFYNQTQTEFLYNLMKDRFKYSYIGAIKQATCSFDGKFNGKFPINEVAYEKKKDEASRDPFGDKKEAEKNKLCAHETYRYVRSKNEWWCIRCGKVVYTNPYTDVNDYDSQLGTVIIKEGKGDGLSADSTENLKVLQ